MSHRPTLCLDFDGVVHRYSRGWQDGSIYDIAVPGFFEWALSAHQRFSLVIYSSRSKTPEGIAAMRNWMGVQAAEAACWHSVRHMIEFLNDLDYASCKPAAFVTIDDRTACFTGDWSAPELQPEALLAFKPWNQQPPEGAGDIVTETKPSAMAGCIQSGSLGITAESRLQGVPEPTCRKQRQELGLPYSKSSCQRCGSLLSPGWRCAEDASKGASNIVAVTEIRTRLTLAAVHETCGGCPSQWEGISDDCRAVYIRYRGGRLQVGVGHDMVDAADSTRGLRSKSNCVAEPWFSALVGEEWGGWISLEDACRHAGIDLAPGALKGRRRDDEEYDASACHGWGRATDVSAL